MDDFGFGSARIRREMDIKEFRVACGNAIGLGDISRDEWETPGTALVPDRLPWASGMFTAKARGDSMEPRICDGTWLLFHPHVVGTRRDRLVLVEDRTNPGGDRYTLKKYRSRKIFNSDGTWSHTEIHLVSLNPSQPDIILKEEEDHWILGWFVGAVREIHRVERPQWPDADFTI